MVDKFHMGLNLMVAPEELGEGECLQGSTDFETDSVGSKLSSRRMLYERATSIALPTAVRSSGLGRITSMRVYTVLTDAGNANRLIMSSGQGVIYTVNPNTGPPHSTVLVLTSGGEWEFQQAQDSAVQQYVWCLNGTTAPQKFNVDTSVISAWAGTPPNGTMHRVWKNMMIIAGVSAQPQRLYFSAIANPESWPANNFIDIKSVDDEADPITAIEVIEENLLVFKKGSTWLVFDPVGFENRRIGEPGCVNRAACCRIRDRVYFAGLHGIFSTDGDTIRYESQNIERLWLGVGRDISLETYRIPALTRLVDTWDDKVLVLNYDTAGDVTSKDFPVMCMDTRITRPDGQHPWYSYGGKGTGASVGNMAWLSVAAKGVFLQVGAVSEEYQPALMAVLRDPASSGVSGAGPQYLVEIWRPGINSTSGAKDLINAVSTQITGLFVTSAIRTKGVENEGRIRRVNLVATKPYTDAVAQEKIEATLTSEILTQVSMGVTALALPAGARMIRFRPELRARWFQLALQVIDGAIISSVEMMFRGGKEH